MADKPNGQTSTVGKESTQTVTVQYETPDGPIHGCDYVNVLATQDDALVLQFFSTTPPVVNAKDGTLLTEVRRRCVGQFHVTPVVAEQIVENLKSQIANMKGK